MPSVQQLRDAADEARAKVQSENENADKNRMRAEREDDTSPLSDQYMNDAQINEQRAFVHKREVEQLEAKASEREKQADKIAQKKAEYQAAMQAEIDKLDAEERMLRG